MRSFVTLAAPAEHTEVIQGSEFLAFAARADSSEEALALLEGVRARFPDASHCCRAYRIGDAYRFHDGGEPGGTAGAPILRAIGSRGLDRVMVVVARYFGGTKLGAGRPHGVPFCSRRGRPRAGVWRNRERAAPTGAPRGSQTARRCGGARPVRVRGRPVPPAR